MMMVAAIAVALSISNGHRLHPLQEMANTRFQNFQKVSSVIWAIMSARAARQMRRIGKSNWRGFLKATSLRSIGPNI